MNSYGLKSTDVYSVIQKLGINVNTGLYERVIVPMMCDKTSYPRVLGYENKSKGTGQTEVRLDGWCKYVFSRGISYLCTTVHNGCKGVGTPDTYVGV